MTTYYRLYAAAKLLVLSEMLHEMDVYGVYIFTHRDIGNSIGNYEFNVQNICHYLFDVVTLW